MQPWPFSADPGGRAVRRLRLRVADEDAKQRARIAIEDGLATADFGDYGRLIFVRRLSLPRFAHDLNSPAAARAIETSFRALLPHAVHGVEPGAHAAPVVWFADGLEMLVEALSLRVEDQPLAEWFWRSAAPAILRTREPEIGELVARVIAFDTGTASSHGATPFLARRWRRWTSIAFARFVAALPREVSAAGAGTERIVPPQHEIAERDHPPMSRALPSRGPIADGASASSPSTEACARIAAAARIDPAKARWIAHWELVTAGIVDLDTPLATRFALADGVIERLAIREMRAVGETGERGLGAERRQPLAGATPHNAHGPDRAPATALGAERRHRGMRRDLGALAAPPWLGDGRISAHAGFFMLVNAWQVVGFHDWIDAQPPHGRAAIARAWLERWARRLRLPVDDVQRAAWTAPAEEPLPADACAALATWMSGTRRWLRAQAHVGPASLVLRDGLVSVTRTHVDVTFGLDDIDLRARRAGLDKDPGWVPWLGRIVAFHFLEDRRGDSAR